MRLYCKCGQCLTKDVQKTSYKDAYNVYEKVEELYSWGDEPDQAEEKEFISREYILKEGTYHKWKRSGRKGGVWFGSKNVYVVSISDITAEVVNECKGCCRRDYFDLQCPLCKEIIGNGCDDCWQTEKAVLYCRKVKVLNKRIIYNEIVEGFEALKGN